MFETNIKMQMPGIGFCHLMFCMRISCLITVQMDQTEIQTGKSFSFYQCFVVKRTLGRESGDFV